MPARPASDRGAPRVATLPGEGAVSGAAARPSVGETYGYRALQSFPLAVHCTMVPLGFTKKLISHE